MKFEGTQKDQVLLLKCYVKTLIRSLILTTTVAGTILGFAACQQPGATGPQGPAGPPGTAIPTVTSHAADGGSSGGGGYVSENSAILLAKSSRTLATMLRNSTPAIYADLPAGWSAERFAKIIENVRSMPDKTLRRDGKELMFNYGKDEKGEFIEALQPFFHVYGAVPVKVQTDAQLRELQSDLMLKLLHESAHLIDLNEEQAEAFATAKLLALELDVYVCTSDLKTIDAQPLRTREYRSAFNGNILIRRSTRQVWHFLYSTAEKNMRQVLDASPRSRLGEFDRVAEGTAVATLAESKIDGSAALVAENDDLRTEIEFNSAPESHFVQSIKTTIIAPLYTANYQVYSSEIAMNCSWH